MSSGPITTAAKAEPEVPPRRSARVKVPTQKATAAAEPRKAAPRKRGVAAKAPQKAAALPESAEVGELDEIDEDLLLDSDELTSIQGDFDTEKVLAEEAQKAMGQDVHFNIQPDVHEVDTHEPPATNGSES